ncbi:MAG: 4-hydroxy-tetrahydrodipicolinate synthase [Solirubrobacteraceae bacterium]|nr:4-hydroxy-tetrahydrodipicolinate synthase [Solirubrobacteraceae bacterium]
MSGLGALLTAIVTPFSASAKAKSGKPALDEEAFVALHQHVIGLGAHGVVACGTTGEASTLDDDEHLRVIELAVQHKPAGSTVVAGVGSNDTWHAVHLTERATELGADALLSVTPYYNRPNRRGIVAHYREVARATDKPILLYNHPGRTGVDLSNDLLAELAQIDGIDGVKQTNDDNLALIDGLVLYTGNDETFGRTLELGGVGGISFASHVAGAAMRRMVDEPEERARIDASLAPLFAALAVAPACTTAKAALVAVGRLASDAQRLPMIEVDDHERAIVRDGLVAAGLLDA